jgi:hypothetical protein
MTFPARHADAYGLGAEWGRADLAHQRLAKSDAEIVRLVSEELGDDLEMTGWSEDAAVRGYRAGFAGTDAEPVYRAREAMEAELENCIPWPGSDK